MSSLAPIPGFTHLSRLEESRRKDGSRLPTKRSTEATALAAIALATYFGVRPATRLKKHTFSPELIQQLTMGTDSQGHPRPVCGPTTLLSAHVHDTGSSLTLVGTVLCTDNSYGYFATFGENRKGLILTELKVTATLKR